MFTMIESPYGKLFYTALSLEKEKKINSDEKGFLKELIINENKILEPLLKALSQPNHEVVSSEVDSFLVSLVQLAKQAQERKFKNKLSKSQGIFMTDDLRKKTKPNMNSYKMSFSANIRESNNQKKEFSKSALLKPNINLKKKINNTYFSDDSIIEYSPISKKEEPVQVKRNASLHIISIKSMNNYEMRTESYQEESNNEGTFQDYYDNIKEEFDLPPINELARLDSSAVFMAYSWFKND